MTYTTAPSRTTLWLKRLRPKSIGGFVSAFLLFLGGWLMVFPFVWMISSSLKPTDEVYDSQFSIIPKTFKGWDNYYAVIFEQPYLMFLAASSRPPVSMAFLKSKSSCV